MSEDQAAAASNEQERYPVPDSETFLLEIAGSFQRGHKALDLWRRWFREFGEPWFTF
ncbi:MAG: hypothetical protein GWN58_26470, partial [Anaerolineae bacterium]|nr:hypothetical protein [Anaerolineae bacterium]